jgi:hypothetical protein
LCPGGEPLVLVEEVSGGTRYLLMYQFVNGLWCIDKTFLIHTPSPGPETVHGDLIDVGYLVGGRENMYVVIEEDNYYRWWILYIVEDGNWTMVREIQVCYRAVDWEMRKRK